MSRQKTKTHKDLIHEIRDPIHGFIKLNDLEKEIIDSIEFQRLHKIHHLALTYQIYPSATHKRFSHSLGAMSFASQIFDILKAKIHYRCNNSKSKYDKIILEQYLTDKNWQILRLTGLLHDIGHPPFSHAGEKCLPANPKTQNKYKHETYTEKIIRNSSITNIIENHDISKSLEITSNDIANQFR